MNEKIIFIDDVLPDTCKRNGIEELLHETFWRRLMNSTYDDLWHIDRMDVAKKLIISDEHDHSIYVNIVTHSECCVVNAAEIYLTNGKKCYIKAKIDFSLIKGGMFDGQPKNFSIRLYSGEDPSLILNIGFRGERDLIRKAIDEVLTNNNSYGLHNLYY